MKKLIGIVGIVILVLASHSLVWAETSIKDSEITMDLITETKMNLTIENITLCAQEKSVAEIGEYALAFMQGSQPENDIRILGICPLYGLNDIVTGYYVTFMRDGSPEGYVLISFLHTGTPIVEFSFGGLGIMEDIDVQDLTSNMASIKYLGADEFYMESVTNGDVKYISLNDDTTIDEASATRIFENSLIVLYDNMQKNSVNVIDNDIQIWNGIVSWNADIIDYNTLYMLPNFGNGSHYWVSTDFPASGDCAPTACTNILWYWGWKYNIKANNYVKRQVDQSGTTKDVATRIYNKMLLGLDKDDPDTTVYENFPDAFTLYFGVYPNTGVWNYKKLTGFFQMYNVIIENCPIYMQYAKSNSAHAVFVLGRVQDTGGNKYVITMNGRDRYGTWIKSNYYEDVKGYKLYVADAPV